MKAWAIAVNTFREAIRDKILYNLLFFALGVMLFSVVIGNLTLGERLRIMQDIGLASMSVFGLLIAIFVGIQLVYKEISRRTVYVLLSKPVHRWQFVLGKYLGLALTIAVNTALMALALFVVLKAFGGWQFRWLMAIGVLLIVAELMLITAVALFFSTFSTPTLSAMFTLGVYVIGHLSADLKVLGAVSKSPGVRELTTAVYYLLPNLENFNLKTEVVYSLPVAPGFVLWALAYGAAYTALLLAASVLVFGQRDFK